MNTPIQQVDVKLTNKQAAVIYCLQNGWCLITSNESKGAWVAKDKFDFHINNGIFWRLVRKGLIAQQLGHPWDYVLTRLGETIKVKEFTLPQL